MTIREKVIKAVNKYVRENGYDTWMDKKTLLAYINSLYSDKEIAPGSFLPTDYCYSRYNDGLKEDYNVRDNLFEDKDARFRLLGENYPYTGDTWHFPRGSSEKPYIVGRWENGRFELYSRGEVNEIKGEQAFQEEAASYVSAIEEEVDSSSLEGREREAVIKTRVNQGIFRKGLLRRYKKCCLCNVQNQNLLIASHIKPWSEAGLNEKVDFDNGLLLCPNHDKLFDLGYISFDKDGKILISSELERVDQAFLNVNDNMEINVNTNTLEYLNYHRENIFRK